MSRRLALLALPLLLAVGCAETGGPEAARRDRITLTPAERFAASVESADRSMEVTVGRMDAFERLASREDTAINYAIGQNARPQLLPPAGGVAELTGRLLAPAFTALGDYGHILAQAATNTPIQAKQSPTGNELAAAAGRALDGLQASAGVNVSPQVREAGLQAIHDLADLPEDLTKARGNRPTLAQTVSAAQPKIVALTTLLREVLGADSDKGVRNAIRTRRLALNDAHGRFLQAVRNDRSAGPAERYSIFRAVAELREGDPAPGTLSQIVTLLTALSTAHDALDEGANDATAKVAGFEAAVDRLAVLGEATRRAGQ